jgi:hypothetical protein
LYVVFPRRLVLAAVVMLFCVVREGQVSMFQTLHVLPLAALKHPLIVSIIRAPRAAAVAAGEPWMIAIRSTGGYVTRLLINLRGFPRKSCFIYSCSH